MKKIMLLFSFVFLIALASCSCSKKTDINKLDGFCKAIEDHISDVKKIEMSGSLKDQSVLVYEISKIITVSSVSEEDVFEGEVEIIKKTLGNDFSLVEDRYTESFSGKKEQVLFQYSLNEEYFKEYQINDGTLTGTIQADKASLALAVSDLKNQNDVSIQIILTEERISKLTLNYTTSASRDASLEIIYTY